MHSGRYVELLGWNHRRNRHYSGDFCFVLVHDVQAGAQTAKQAGSPHVGLGRSVFVGDRPRHRPHARALGILGRDRRRPQGGHNHETERTQREYGLNCAGNREEQARHGLLSAESQAQFIPWVKKGERILPVAGAASRGHHGRSGISTLFFSGDPAQCPGNAPSGGTSLSVLRPGERPKIAEKQNDQTKPLELYGEPASWRSTRGWNTAVQWTPDRLQTRKNEPILATVPTK